MVQCYTVAVLHLVMASNVACDAPRNMKPITFIYPLSIQNRYTFTLWQLTYRYIHSFVLKWFIVSFRYKFILLLPTHIDSNLWRKEHVSKETEAGLR